MTNDRHDATEQRTREVWRTDDENPAVAWYELGVRGEHDVDRENFVSAVEAKREQYSPLLDREGAAIMVVDELGRSATEEADDVVADVWGHRGGRERRRVEFDRQLPNGRFAPEEVRPDDRPGVDRAPDGRFVSERRRRANLQRRGTDGRFASEEDLGGGWL